MKKATTDGSRIVTVRKCETKRQDRINRLLPLRTKIKVHPKTLQTELINASGVSVSGKTIKTPFTPVTHVF